MSRYLIHNGDLKDADAPLLHANNRAFLLGDGLFESIRILAGKPCFLDTHFNRLCETMKVLQLEKPFALTQEKLYADLVELARQNEMSSAKARVTIYRDSAGAYLPESNKVGYVIDLHRIAENSFMLNDIGLNTDIYPDMRKPLNKLAIHKTLNANFFIMASLWAKEKGLDNCLIQNDRGNIIEAANSNIFIVSNSVLYTPAISDGCLGGVMRAQVINMAIKHNIKVYECSLNPQNLLAADELFLTNAVRGIAWVSNYRTKKYVDRMSRQLTEMLNKEVLS